MKSKILIVDDSEFDLQILGEYLHSVPCELLRAKDAYEAILACERESPDLVVLDILLPGPDGIQVLREIKETAPEDYLPVVLVSARANAEYRHVGMEAGADAFLDKPLNPIILQDTVRNLLGLRTRMRHLILERDRLRRQQESRQMLSNLLVHDLRNPLTVVQSNLDFLKAEMDQQADPEWVSAIVDSQGATERLLRMVANIIDAARLDEGETDLEYTRIDAAELLHDVAARGAAVLRGYEIQLGPLPENLLLQADRDLVARALGNFLDTAARFAPAGSVLELRVAPASNQRVRFSVFARGVLLSPELRTHLFQRFHRVGLHVPPSVRHAALGLFLCRLVAAAHRGEAGVTLGDQGTTFSLSLPGVPPTAGP